MPFKKGQSGNPGGRPKGIHITALIREFAQKPVPGDESGLTRQELLADLLWRMALKGNEMAYRTILERAEGKVKDRLELETRPALHFTDSQLALIASGKAKAVDFINNSNGE